MVPLSPPKKSFPASVIGFGKTLLPSKWPLPARRKVTLVKDLQLAAPSSTADPLPATTPQLRCSPAPAVLYILAAALALQWSGPEGHQHLGHDVGRQLRYCNVVGVDKLQLIALGTNAFIVYIIHIKMYSIHHLNHLYYCSFISVCIYIYIYL